MLTLFVEKVPSAPDPVGFFPGNLSSLCVFQTPEITSPVDSFVQKQGALNSS